MVFSHLFIAFSYNYKAIYYATNIKYIIQKTLSLIASRCINGRHGIDV